MKTTPLPVQIFQSAYDQIKGSIGLHKAETGGYLFGNRSDFIVKKFVFDKNELKK